MGMMSKRTVEKWWWDGEGLKNLKWIRRSEKRVREKHFMTNQISIRSRIIMNIREFNSEIKFKKNM